MAPAGTAAPVITIHRAVAILATMKTTSRLIAAGIALAALTACGAKGPLFLPKDATPVEVPAEPAPADLPPEPPIELPADASATPAAETPATPAAND